MELYANLITSFNLPMLSICIPTLHNYEALHRCLNSIKEHTFHIDYEIVIVDSASRIRGYTGPMNQAMEASRGNIIIALNDDVEVTPGWVDPLIAEIENGTWVCFPDQRSTDGNQVLCGWCVVWSREAFTVLKGYDDRFTMWCTDIDLARRLIELGKPAVRVTIPTPLIHQKGGNQTVGRQDIRDYTQPTGTNDLVLYRTKWGTEAQEDKYRLYEGNFT